MASRISAVTLRSPLSTSPMWAEVAVPPHNPRRRRAISCVRKMDSTHSPACALSPLVRRIDRDRKKKRIRSFSRLRHEAPYGYNRATSLDAGIERWISG
jgi:hypothetical protein